MKITNKKISQTKFIAQAVAKAARVAIQAMVATSTSRQDNAGLKMNKPIMKQPMFHWNAKDKYEELQNLKLEVINRLHSYNLGQTEIVCIIKNKEKAYS